MFPYVPAMPPLASYPYVAVRLGCSRCGREGQHRLARLAAKYGAEIDIAAHLAGDCAMCSRQRHPVKERCGAFFVDIGSPKPLDIPAAMRGLKVVRRRQRNLIVHDRLKHAIVPLRLKSNDAALSPPESGFFAFVLRRA